MIANDHPINPVERHEHYKKIITTGHPKPREYDSDK